METKVEKLKESKVKTTTVIADPERLDAERKALTRLAEQVEIKGFRIGKAPADKVRERVGEERVLEETVRVLLPQVLKEGLDKSGAKPIVRPAATIVSAKPLTIALTFVNRPPVSVKKPDGIKVEKKTIQEVTSGDVDDFIRKILLQDRAETPVDRPAAQGDSVRIAMKATKKGVQVDELTVGNYNVLLGSEELFPELQSHLVGMKKDETKTVTIAFSKDHDIAAIRGEKISIEITVKSVAEVKVPDLTPEYIKNRLGSDKSPDDLRKDIKTMLGEQRTNTEMKRREEEFYEKVRGATSVEIANELIDTEVQEMVRDLHERLERQGTTVEQWLTMTGKDEKSVVEEMRGIAKSRTTLRFGMQEMAEKLGIEPDAQAMAAALKSTAARASASGQALPDEELKPGGSVYENLRYELRMQTLRDRMISDEASKKLAA